VAVVRLLVGVALRCGSLGRYTDAIR
jgi:hypothetical protein